MLKLIKWMIPLGATTIMVVPMMTPSVPHFDMVNTIVNLPPSQSSLRSNRYTQPEIDDRLVTTNAFADLEGYELRGSFAGYSFYDHGLDASFRIRHDQTGYIWASSINVDYTTEVDSPLADPDDLGLNVFWQNKVRSPFFLSYYQGLNLKEEHAFEHHLSRLTMTRIAGENYVGFQVQAFLFISKIAFSYSVKFSNEGLSIDVPFDSIRENSSLALASISMYPMLGATKRLRTPGYVVVPDGVGALIRYTDDANMGVYSKRFFGQDLGIGTPQFDQPLFANMYGLVHGHRQHAMLGMITDGAAHALLNHFGSQVFLDFNFTYVTFSYRTTYRQFLNQAKTSSVNLLQRDLLPIDIGLRYQFLQGQQADYVGLANAFSAWRFSGVSPRTLHPSIPLHLDVLALESKPGLFNREKVVMTTVSEYEAILNAVASTITDHIYSGYLGWQEGGYSLTAPYYNRLDGSLGNQATWTKMLDSLDREATHVFLGVDPYRASVSAARVQNRDIIQTIGQEYLIDQNHYGLSAIAGHRFLEQARTTGESLKVNRFALETIGHQLASNFAGTPMPKQSMIEAVMDVIQPDDAVYRPMSYAWNAQGLFDLPMYSSEHARMTDTIPLIPYMIRGYRDGFGRAGNFFSNTTNELLRMIDYGLYPAFFITDESAYQLIDTPSESIFTSRYEDWQPEIKRQYEFIARALNAVRGQRVRSRDVLQFGVVKVQYEGGTTILINYGGEPFQDGLTMVAPMNYVVVEVGS